MPPQSVAHARALGDEVVAVIEQQADLHCLLVQIRGREAVGPVLDDRAGDRERVDLVRLPRLTLPAPGGAHPLGCDAHDPFAGGQQRLLQPAGDLPAILDRPHPLIIEPARPFDRGQVPRLVRVNLTSATDPARALVDSRERMRALVRVRPDHDHLRPSPSFG